MDETTKLIIAYAALLLGIPIATSRIIWVIPGAVSTRALAQIGSRLDEFADAAIEGFISLLLACLLFEKLELRVGWKVPVLLIIISSLWNWFNEKTLQAWLSAIGIIAGFYLYPTMSASLRMYLHFRVVG